VCGEASRLRDLHTRGELLNVRLDTTAEKAHRLLGWSPRSSEEAIVAAAESLVRLGLVQA